MADVPHVAFPWTMAIQSDGTFGVNVVEQDSLEDIMSCVQEIVACPIGAWIDQPSFGIQSGLFSQTPIDPSTVSLALSRWEPRAAVVAAEYPDAISDATRHLLFDVSAPQADQ